MTTTKPKDTIKNHARWLVRLYDSLPGLFQMVAAKAYYAVGWRVFPESGLFARTSEEDLIAQFFQSEAELRRYETEFDQIQDPDTPTDPKQRESVRYPEGAAEEAAYLRSVNVDPRVHEAIYELYAAGFEEVPRDPTS